MSCAALAKEEQLLGLIRETRDLSGVVRCGTMVVCVRFRRGLRIRSGVGCSTYELQEMENIPCVFRVTDSAVRRRSPGRQPVIRDSNWIFGGKCESAS